MHSVVDLHNNIRINTTKTVCASKVKKNASKEQEDGCRGLFKI